MLSSDEGEDCTFFDSVDYLTMECSVSGNLGDEVWLNEPLSVKERRKNFMSGMGLVEFANSVEMMGLSRVANCSIAVSSSSVSSMVSVDNDVICGRTEINGEANLMVDDLVENQLNETNVMLDCVSLGLSCSELEHELSEGRPHKEEVDNINSKNQIRRWCKLFSKKKKGVACNSDARIMHENAKSDKTEVGLNKKKFKELTAVYMGQEIQAHKGLIWTMKFSPDGKYLATGGEDGVVRIWWVTSVDASSKLFASSKNFGSQMKKGKKSSHGSVVFPDKVFQIDESPLQKFHGHASDVLDLAWSSSKYLLSSSKDKTVRLWQVGDDKCLNVFRHNNYVTCIEFNPVDENYFISGSIDGKVRIWGVSEKRVVDWVDILDVITAICYRPNGKGFVVGSITGACRFYEESAGKRNQQQLESQVVIRGKSKASNNKITGIQFSGENSQRVVITSEDKKIRIFDGIDLVHKYKGIPKSGSQMSAKLASTGKHIISIDEESRVYIWNYDSTSTPPSKKPKSVRTCEHFISDGVSVAIPWTGMTTEQASLNCNNHRYGPGNLGVSLRMRDPNYFTFDTLFSNDGPSRSSATWPEEKLPLWDLSDVENRHYHPHFREEGEQDQDGCSNNHRTLPKSWGLVIVTGGVDGTIRTFHNYGLPVRV